jgi:LmeA-like phospholipid-binding
VSAPTQGSPDRYYGDGYPPQPPGPSPRRRHRGRRWLIVLITLAVLVVAADRIALVVAEHTLASKIQQEQHLSQRPDVSISGFPFLTQVASRDFGHVTVDIHGLVTNDVPITDIHADLTGVHVSSGYDSATVDTLVGTAKVDYADLDKALAAKIDVGEVTVSPGSGNDLKATYGLLGMDVTATLAVSIQPDNVLEVKAVSFSGLLGSISAPSNFDYRFSLGALPFGLSVDKLEATPAALEVSATGHDVSLSQTTVHSP